MAEYINRVDAINALTSDEADESMTVYLDGLYGRLMAIKKEPVISLSDVLEVAVNLLTEFPESSKYMSAYMIKLISKCAERETGYHDD